MQVHRVIRVTFALFILFAPALAQLPSPATVTLNGQSYTLQAHPRVYLDGPSGALTGSLSNTGPQGRANPSANPVFNTLTSTVNGFVSGGYSALDSLYYGPIYRDPLGVCSAAALDWQATGSASALALAQYCIGHVEEIVGGSMGCDQTLSYCGNRFADQDYTSMNLMHVAQTFSIVRSTLTSAQISLFAAKVLNDNTLAHNGIDTNACTNQGMVLSATATTLSASVNNATVTGTNTAFTSFSPGDTLMDNQGNIVGRIQSIASDTQLTLSQSAAETVTNTQFYRSPVWTAGNCGIIWFIKHHNGAPAIGAPCKSSATASACNQYTLDYPPAGGSWVYPAGNLTYTKLLGYIAVGLALADDDPRAITLLQQAYDFYIGLPTDPNAAPLAGQYEYALSGHTGFTQAGGAYSVQRTDWFTTSIAIMMQNSVVGGPDLLGTNYLRRFLPYWYYIATPADPTQPMYWGDIYQTALDLGISARPLLENIWLWRNTPEGQMANYYLAHRSDANSSGSHGGSYLLWWYIFQDPAIGQINPDTGSTSYLFADSDFSQCQTLSGSPTCFPNNQFQYFISKSDWTSTATELQGQAGVFQRGLDHLGNGAWGSYHIFRQVPLLTGDGESCGNWSGSIAEYAANSVGDNLIELGGADNWAAISAFAPVTRWAGADPTGDPNGNYAYALTDLSHAYKPGVAASRVQRHILHFKAPSTQDYIVDYDDIATTTGNEKKAYFGYYIGGGSPTVKTSANSATLSAGSAELVTNFLAVPGAEGILFTPEGTSYPGNSQSCSGAGNTFRVNVCTSSNAISCDTTSTAAEWIAIHLPTKNTGATMPPISQPACSATGGQCTVVDIQDPSSPKVAAFARQGSLISSVSFTSTHLGTAQYVIAGLTPGTYFATSNGTVVNPSGTIVNSGDNTLSFESTSGPITVSQNGFTLAVSPSSQTITQQNGNLSATFTITVNPLGSFSGPVNFSVTGMPATGSPAPAYSVPAIASLSGPTQTTLTVSIAANTTPGSYPLTVTASNGSGPAISVIYDLTLVVGGSFSSTLTSSASQAVLPVANISYNTATYNFSVGTIGLFNGTVSLVAAATSGPALGSVGITASGPGLGLASLLSLLTGNTTSTALNLAAGPNTPAGIYPVTVTTTGTSGLQVVTQTTNVNLVVNDFSVTSGNATASVTSGGSASYGLTITPLAAYAGQVDLSVSGLPAGATPSIAGATQSAGGWYVPTASGAAKLTLAITTSASIVPKNYTITVNATDHSSGALTHSISYALSVSGYTLAVSPGSQSVQGGSTASYTLTAGSVNGYSGKLSLASVTGLPSGATGSLVSPIAVAGAQGTGTFQIVTSKTTPPGTYSNVVVTTADTVTLAKQSVTLTLVIKSLSTFAGSARGGCAAGACSTAGKFVIPYSGTLSCQANDVIFVGAASMFSNATMSIRDSGGAIVWTPIPPVNGSTTTSAAGWWGVCSSLTSGTITITCTSGCNSHTYMDGVAQWYQTPALTPSGDGAGASTSTGTMIVAAPAANFGDLSFAFAVNKNSGAESTATSGWTKRASGLESSSFGFDNLNSGSGSVSVTIAGGSGEVAGVIQNLSFATLTGSSSAQPR